MSARPQPPPRSWWQRLKDALRPPRTLKVTRTGRTYLILTIGVGLGALNTGNNLLYLVLGLQLAMIVVSGVLSERALSGLRVRRLGAESPYAGEPFGYRWALSREQGYSFGITISEEGSGIEGHATAPVVGPGGEVVIRGELTAERRGPHRLGEVKITTTYPLGLFAKSRTHELPATLLVYPRRGFSCAPPPPSRNGPVGPSPHSRGQDGGGDLAGLRELAEGEDARRIHWLKSAAANRLLRTEREREERRSYLLEVDGAMPDPQKLDRRCEELATLAQQLLVQGHEVGLNTGRRRLRPSSGPGQLRRLLDALAWAGFEDQEPSPLGPSGVEGAERSPSAPAADRA